MPRTNSIPTYRKHRASGQAIVTLSGRDHYLGPHGTAASRQRYDALIAEWTAAGRRIPSATPDLSIAELVAAFRHYAKEFYCDADGNVSKTVQNFDESLRPVVRLFAKTFARDFGPVKLAACRQALIDDGVVRSNVNRHVSRIRAVFKWGVSTEMLPASLYHGLMALSGLRIGRGGVIESAPVKPVAIEHVGHVRPKMSRTIRAMVDLMLTTGMRPGELVLMRGCDLNMSSDVWQYRPRRHKTMGLGHERMVPLGPVSQQTLKPFLKIDLQAHIFSPREAERERRELLTARRLTPASCGNSPGSNRCRKPMRGPGDHYTTGSFNVAVRRACDAAFPPPTGMADAADLKKWRTEHSFHVHQLRHTAGTLAREKFGAEGAQALLGHRTLKATEIYAEKSADLAQRVATAMG